VHTSKLATSDCSSGRLYSSLRADHTVDTTHDRLDIGPWAAMPEMLSGFAAFTIQIRGLRHVRRVTDNVA